MKAMQAKIERIKVNVKSAFDVLKEKGVEVHEGATSKDLAGLIAQLPSLKNE